MVELGTQIAGEKYEQIYRKAFALFSTTPDWVTFFRQIMGVGGIIRTTFSSKEELSDFERSETFGRIQQMLGKLREPVPTNTSPAEPNRVITVRLPESLHEKLRVEAHDYRTSVNKLCISKLLQFIENDLVPEDKWTPKNIPEGDGKEAKQKDDSEEEGTGADQ
jgi:predicted HicB family RNase H-like nuclease